eukprot:CAMPEP_0197541038 /NCGR_PEP_ID=MMETSP1318-20131121/66938_1 /TAXON_ID=552666 /ORGANISM="Partenskyella glossopodia, Strain RCC365" /LENGTH=95 /DNA_ID=CAMNT_0043100169 /DNA_START=159 /DNA_END=443 /DNA_ORIENTATION=-
MAKKVRMLRATKDYVSLPAKGQSASKEGSISKKKCIAARPANARCANEANDGAPEEGSISKKKCIAARPANARCANEANDGAPVTDRSPADPGKW